MGQAKRFAVGVAMTGVTLVALFFIVRRLPTNFRALFQP